jgi:plastocyanin
MDGQWRRLGVVVVVFVVVAVASAVGPVHPARAQGPQTWQILVNNISPEGQNWSFNAFYPDQLQVHPGDTIVFTLAPNPLAFHTVTIPFERVTPLAVWSGFSGGFAAPNPLRRDTLQSTFFQGERRGGPDLPLCGRAGGGSCLIDGHDPATDSVSCGVLVNPPPQGGQGNTSCTITLAPEVPPGYAYYFTSLVDGPSMSGRIDVLPPNVPVQSAAVLQANAQRQYDADLAWLAGRDRVTNPPEESRPDGTKIWRAAAGRGSPNPQLSINAFAPAQIVVAAGDTVLWTHDSPSVVPHTVSGFVPSLGGMQPDQNPFQPVCVSDEGEETLPPPGSFPPDIWNTCPTDEANNFTAFSQPSAPSGAPYTDGARTSGILLNQAYLDSPTGDGLPFLSSYAVTFPNPGSYAYVCAIHQGMEGVVVVTPKPMPR